MTEGESACLVFANKGASTVDAAIDESLGCDGQLGKWGHVGYCDATSLKLFTVFRDDARKDREVEM